MKSLNQGEIEKKFLSVKNQRDVFTACLELKMQDDDNGEAILEQTCQELHKFSARIKSIGDRVFNTFSKNFVGELNEGPPIGLLVSSDEPGIWGSLHIEKAGGNLSLPVGNAEGV